MITPCTGHAAESERDEWMASILERLHHHSLDTNNTAFSRSTMFEAADYIRSGVQPVHIERAGWTQPWVRALATSEEVRAAMSVCAPAPAEVSELEARILRDYTHKQPCVVDGFPDAHTAWLRVGVQSFCVTPNCCDTADEAEWTQSMLAKALVRLVRETAATAPAPAEVPMPEPKGIPKGDLNLMSDTALIDAVLRLQKENAELRHDIERHVEICASAIRDGDAREAAGYARGRAEADNLLFEALSALKYIEKNAANVEQAWRKAFDAAEVLDAALRGR